MKDKISSVAILGVDGTGKSTVLKCLKFALGNKCRLQYMGYRDFKNLKVDNIKNKENKTIIEKIQLLFGVRNELLSRVRENKDFNGVIIYDRYVHEIYINAPRKSQIIYKILYKYLFPKVDAIVYLYCDVKTSLKRKTDILDVEQFILMKERFDSEFLNRNSVLALSSDELMPDELAEKIIKYIRC